MSGQRRWATERLRERAGGPLKAHGGAGPSPGPSVLDGAARHRAGGGWGQEGARRVEKGLLVAPGWGSRARLASTGSSPRAPGRSGGGGRRGPPGRRLFPRGACLFWGLVQASGCYRQLTMPSPEPRLLPGSGARGRLLPLCLQQRARPWRQMVSPNFTDGAPARVRPPHSPRGRGARVGPRSETGEPGPQALSARGPAPPTG